MPESIVVLSYRGLLHYWPLVLRQLALPVGVKGEALPYRTSFVLGNLEDLRRHAKGKKALICLKIDPSETLSGRSYYVPLRFGTICEVDLAPGSASVIRIVYETGHTPDYTDADSCLVYSDQICSAVSSAAGVDHPGDEALVARVDLDGGSAFQLTSQAETDRWIALTRVLGDTGRGAKPLVEDLHDHLKEVYKAIYPKVLFMRWDDIPDARKPKGCKKDAYGVNVDRQYDAVVVSSLLAGNVVPDPSFRWELRGSRTHFDFLNFSAEIGPGILFHRFPFEPKRASGTPVNLSLAQVSGPGSDESNIHPFDLHVTVKPAYTPAYKLLFFLVLLCLAAGVVLAAGIVDKELVRTTGLGEEAASRVEDFAGPVGAALLIVGAVLGYWRTAGRAGGVPS